MRPLVAGIATALALLVVACSGPPPPEPPESLPPPEAFGDFAVGEFGGVDGRQNILRVRADGVALLISRAPASGRLSGSDLRRLRTLLTSEQFRREAAQGDGQDAVPPCTDQIITEVRMGSLAVRRTGPCGQESAPPAPAFSEILTITAPARQGVFAGPVATREPPLVAVRLQRHPEASQPGYVIIVDARGRASITEPGRPSRTGRLAAGDADTLRLLLPLLNEGPVVPCNSEERYRLRIDDGQERPDCSAEGRYPEYRAVVALLENAL